MKKLIIICAVMLIASPALAAWNSVHTPDANTLGLWHFDAGSGQTIYDSSGNGYDGVMIEQINGHGGDTIQMTSAESWVPSMTGFGTALSAYYEVYNSNVNANTGGIYINQWGDTEGNKLDRGQWQDLTIEFWMNPKNGGHSWGERIIKHYTGGDYGVTYGTGNAIHLQYWGYLDDLGGGGSTGWKGVSDDYAITANEWTHVAICIQRSNNPTLDFVQFFYNGVPNRGYVVGAATGGTPNVMVSMFNDSWAGTTYNMRNYEGLLDEVRISDNIRYIPEPATLSLLAVALLALRRKK
jgi:hypothetical protein